jgi:hypothetical protein
MFQKYQKPVQKLSLKKVEKKWPKKAPKITSPKMRVSPEKQGIKWIFFGENSEKTENDLKMSLKLYQ